MQAALIFCSDHSAKHLGSSIRSEAKGVEMGVEVSDDVNMLKQAALQFENVLPVGVDPAQIAIHSKKFGFKYDLLSRLIPAVPQSQSFAALRFHHTKVHHQFMAGVRATLDLRSTHWWDDGLSANKEQVTAHNYNNKISVIISVNLNSILSQSNK